ncbi:MAG: hypothetical protein PCFJNLEI_00611 [Verrucomicrobiae bacterium]|nr:hypothetical protein [Verrucomicrobiae bacterium]
MKPCTLSPDQIDHFITDGCTILRDAFPAHVAADVREFLWNEIGLSPTDPSGWTKHVIHLQKTFNHGPFAAAYTDRIWGAFDDVLGAGRYVKQTHLGWWPICFPGFEKAPWQPPTTGWHVDGIQFHHHVHSPDQGLLPIFLFSDMGPGDGGTAFSVGSHKITAQILAEAEPAGLDVHALCQRVLSRPGALANVLPAIGQAGDVVLLHPFMLHARSPNVGQSVRFLCNPCVSLHEPMNLNRTNPADYSPVERAIVQALAAPRS